MRLSLLHLPHFLPFQTLPGSQFFGLPLKTVEESSDSFLFHSFVLCFLEAMLTSGSWKKFCGGDFWRGSSYSYKKTFWAQRWCCCLSPSNSNHPYPAGGRGRAEESQPSKPFYLLPRCHVSRMRQYLSSPPASRSTYVSSCHVCPLSPPPPILNARIGLLRSSSCGRTIVSGVPSSCPSISQTLWWWR